MKNIKLTAGNVVQYPTNLSAKNLNVFGSRNARGMNGKRMKIEPSKEEKNNNKTKTIPLKRPNIIIHF